MLLSVSPVSCEARPTGMADWSQINVSLQVRHAVHSSSSTGAGSLSLQALGLGFFRDVIPKSRVGDMGSQDKPQRPSMEIYPPFTLTDCTARTKVCHLQLHTRTT